MSPRTLACTNRTLYISMTCFVLAACIYTLLKVNLDDMQRWAAIGGIAIALLWGGYYALLRFRVDEKGITRKLLGCQNIAWEDITDIELQEKDLGSIQGCTLLFHGKGEETLRLSSELISLDEMQALVSELRELGKLPPAPLKEEGETEAPATESTETSAKE